MRSALMLASAAVLVFVVLWIVLLVTSDSSGSMPEQLERLRASSARYRWTFVNASLVAPALITSIVLLFDVPARAPGGSTSSEQCSSLRTWPSSAWPTCRSTPVSPILLAGDGAGARRLYFADP